MKKKQDASYSGRFKGHNLILKMKLTILILMGCLMQVSATVYSQATKFTFKVEARQVNDVLKEIEEKSDFRFFYQREQVDVTRKVDLQVSDQSVEAILGELFRDQNVIYNVLPNNLIVLTPKTDNSTAIGIQNEKKVSGKVTDATGGSLPGVSVSLKGTTIGTITNADGKYALSNTPENGTLVFSFVGYDRVEKVINNLLVVNIVMKETVEELSEVVITALGIKKEAKSLGYSTATVSAEQATVNRTSNFMNALEGKMSGVNITALGSGSAGTSKIRIRGQSSFGGNNSPLIVVNGVPIDNTNFGARGDVSDRGSNRTSDSGDGLSSIDPDNIESMTVLKGAVASALYGSRAKDGVIMITTKNRAKGSGIGIEFNSNYTNDTPLDFTDYQYEYGQGENGVRPKTAYPTSGQWSFGEKFAPGMTQILFDGVEVPYTPQPNQISQYYRKGSNLTNTISISSGGEFGGVNISFSNMKSQAILPGSDYDRKNVNIGFTQVMAKKLTISGNMSYSNENRNNPPNIGEQDYSPVVIFNMANSMPMDLLKKYATDGNGDEFLWSRFTNRTNPYFALTRFEHILRDRIFGNVTARYDITKWLYLQGRLGQDYYTRSQDYNLPTGSQRQTPAPTGFVNGQYVQDVRRFREINNDVLIGAKHTIKDFNIDVTLGGNQMYRKLDRNNVLVQDFYSRGLYTLGNGRQLSPIYDISERQVNSVYGAAEISYKGYLYFNGTLRNDWFSTLSKENRSILYPSITSSLVFSELFKSSMPEWLTFGKIRAAYAEVGSDTDVAPYSSNLFYAINPSQFPNPSGTGQPLAAINASTVPNPNLRPMRVVEKEVGLELKLFKNRLSMEVSYYNKLSSDQILQAQTSDASGYSAQLINVGKSINKGLEMMVNASPISRKNLIWNININAAYNVSKVLSLGAGVSDTMITVGTGDYSGELRQVVGKPIGQLFGYGYLRDAKGNQIFDAGNGRPLRTANQIDFGSAVPVWTGGINNSVTYKGINLSVAIDFKLGNKMISGTNFNAWRHGLAKETLVGRDLGYVVGKGVNLDGKVNATQSGVQAYYETVRSQNIAEEFVYNAGLWQLRQISLGYDFTKYVRVVKFIKGLKLSAVGNNVAVLKKWVPNIHPEQFGFPSDNLIGLESTGLPITRSIGFNINIKF
ncbi:MAG: SusC/RagA family TonB-linked outer membrane protein [Prolixibacteraceae bacterium]